MMGLVGTLYGLGSVVLPVLIEKLKQEYGFRGCMAILAALNLHVLLGMIAMHPVEWHVDLPPNKLIERNADYENELRMTAAPMKPILYVTC